jgi:hypothetical protein
LAYPEAKSIWGVIPKTARLVVYKPGSLLVQLSARLNHLDHTSHWISVPPGNIEFADSFCGSKRIAVRSAFFLRRVYNAFVSYSTLSPLQVGQSWSLKAMILSFLIGSDSLHLLNETLISCIF